MNESLRQLVVPESRYLRFIQNERQITNINSHFTKHEEVHLLNFTELKVHRGQISKTNFMHPTKHKIKFDLSSLPFNLFIFHEVSALIHIISASNFSCVCQKLMPCCVKLLLLALVVLLFLIIILVVA